MDVVDLSNDRTSESMQNYLNQRYLERMDAASNKNTVCQYCGIDIPEARLKCVPGVQYCIDCQKLYDNGEL